MADNVWILTFVERYESPLFGITTTVYADRTEDEARAIFTAAVRNDAFGLDDDELGDDERSELLALMALATDYEAMVSEGDWIVRMEQVEVHA